VKRVVNGATHTHGNIPAKPSNSQWEELRQLEQINEGGVWFLRFMGFGAEWDITHW